MGTTEGGVLSGQDLLATPLSQFFVQAIIVILLTRTLAVGLYYVGQPRVIAEVIGGIILGPSVFGRHIHGFSDRVFPRASLASLALVANIGLVLYLFLVGIEMDPGTMVKNARKTFLVALSGVGLPFALGFAIGPFLFEQLMAPEAAYASVSKRSFTVFVCVAISITAFPVLARILNETNMLKTTVGNTAMGAAALDDVTAWSLLALSIAMIHAGNPETAAFIFLSVVAFAIGVLGLVRPVWSRIVNVVQGSGSHALRMSLMALTFLMVFFSAWVTEILGVHAIFGAFLFGLAMPRGHPFTLEVSEKIEDIVQIVFLPLYFTLSGLKTDISELHSGRDAGLLVLVLSTATAAKFIGCTFGAKLTGLNLREATTVGVLMNTRGLVELIVLNVGLEAKVISPKLFTIMVLMAITTTVMTTPLVNLIYPMKYRTYVEDVVEGEDPKGRRVERGPHDVELQVVVHNLEEVPALASLMHLLKPDKDGVQRITASSLVEASIATTDIVRATQGDAIKPELPALQMLQAIGILVGAKVETEEIVGNPRTFAEVLTRKGLEHRVDISLIPHRSTLHFVSDSYDGFLQDYINHSPSVVALLVSGTSQTHSILAHHGKRREILVIITGVESDYELLALASRFARWPDVEVTLLIVQEDEQGPPPLDQRLLRALEDFRSSVSDAARVTTENLSGPDLTYDNLATEAQMKEYDFVLVSHCMIDASGHSRAQQRRAAASAISADLSASGHTRRSTAASGSADYGAITGDDNRPTTPKHGGGSKKVSGTSVLGTIGAHLAAATIPASLLVVHGAHSSVELTHRQHHLSLSKAEDKITAGLEMKRLARKMEEYLDGRGDKTQESDTTPALGGADNKV